MVITGTGQQGVEANSNLLNRLEWMFNTTPGRYNEQQDPRATVRSLCAAEADKMAKSQALQKKPHLVLVSGQGGSGTRQISDFCQRFPSFSIGPLSDTGQDSAIFHLPQSADDFSLFTVASQLKNPFCLVNTSLQKTSSDCHDLDDHALSYWQDGMCQSLQALRSWRETCHPAATHVLFKEPLIAMHMPLVLAARTCQSWYQDEKFIHVVRDPRMHHHPHKTIELYNYMFSRQEQEEHIQRLSQVFGVGPTLIVENAFNIQGVGRDPTLQDTAGEIMRFALSFQARFLQAHEAWLEQRPKDYFLLRVEDVSPPATEDHIRHTLQQLLQMLELPDDEDVMNWATSMYDTQAALQDEPQLKVAIIEEFAAEALRVAGYKA